MRPQLSQIDWFRIPIELPTNYLRVTLWHEAAAASWRFRMSLIAVNPGVDPPRCWLCLNREEVWPLLLQQWPVAASVAGSGFVAAAAWLVGLRLRAGPDPKSGPTAESSPPAFSRHALRAGFGLRCLCFDFSGPPLARRQGQVGEVARQHGDRSHVNTAFRIATAIAIAAATPKQAGRICCIETVVFNCHITADLAI